MYSMTDLHSHALCLVDDGAKSIEEMQEMLDIAYNDGIRQICFTPHFKQYHFENDEQILYYNKKIRESFSLAYNYISDKHYDMKLHLGNEIMYHHDIYSSISNGSCARISDTSYALVEFVPDAPYFEIKTALSNLLRKGVRPILAHIERYECLAKDMANVLELREIGVLMQVNASSITKLKIGKSARFVKSLFKKSFVDLIATDAHGSTHYRPLMSEAVSIIEKKYGASLAKSVSCTVPNMILENKKVR